MQRLKIGILVDRITPGATPKFLGREVQHLRELGHDAEGISILDSGLPEGHHQFEEYLADIPIRYISQKHKWLRRLDFKIPPFSFFGAFDVAAFYALPRILKKDANPYDLIIAHASIACLIANSVYRKAGIPYLAYLWDPIAFIVDDVYRHRLPRPLFSLAYRIGRRLDRRIIDESLVTVCGSVPHQQVIQRYDGRQVEVVYPGVDIADSIPETRGEYLFTIDRWDIGNMPTMLLDVLARLTKPLKLKVAGFWWPPKQEDEFRRAVKEKGLQDQVEILGPVSEVELYSLFRGARAHLPPRWTGVSFTVNEAAANGCPSVMQDTVDRFVDGVHGFFPPRGDLELYTARTEQLVQDERLAWELGKNAWELIQEVSWPSHSERLEELIMKSMAS